MASKRGLGKGLSALITDNTNIQQISKQDINDNSNGVITIQLNKIEPNREQPRRTFNEDTLVELADSIKQFGIIQPLIVQKKNDYYEIIAGERRWRAAKLAGIKEAPVIIKGYSEQEILEISLIENIQREDLNPIEEAEAYRRLIDEFNLKQDDIAEKVSKSRSAVANALRLLNLDKKVRQMIVDEMITSGHARTLLSIEDKELQIKIANKIFDEKLSVRETEKLVKALSKPEKKAKSKNDVDPVYNSIEEHMKELLGTKVNIINKDGNKGQIEIEYYSQDELERIRDFFDKK